MTKDAILNALTVDMALGCSTEQYASFTCYCT